MFVFEFNLQKIDIDQPATAAMSIEELRGTSWSRSESKTITTDTPEAQGRLVLKDNQRVVLEPIVVNETVYDNEQRLARPMTREEKIAAHEAARTGRHAEDGPVAMKPGIAPVDPLPPSGDNRHPTAHMGPVDAPQNSTLGIRPGPTAEQLKPTPQQQKAGGASQAMTGKLPSANQQPPAQNKTQFQDAGGARSSTDAKKDMDDEKGDKK